jgi:hypothetical protein
VIVLINTVHVGVLMSLVKLEHLLAQKERKLTLYQTVYKLRTVSHSKCLVQINFHLFWNL